jgi:hypothetical protein
MVTGLFLCSVLRQRSYLPAPSLTAVAIDLPDKAKPVARRELKATGFDEMAGLPKKVT